MLWFVFEYIYVIYICYNYWEFIFLIIFLLNVIWNNVLWGLILIKNDEIYNDKLMNIFKNLY